MLSTLLVRRCIGRLGFWNVTTTTTTKKTTTTITRSRLFSTIAACCHRRVVVVVAIPSQYRCYHASSFHAQLVNYNNNNSNSNDDDHHHHPEELKPLPAEPQSSESPSSPSHYYYSSSSSRNLPPLPFQSLPLGDPMPMDEHACSVSLPTWSSVVGYEEGVPEITQAMTCGYPRFVYHKYIKQLMSVVVSAASPDEDCLVLPTLPAAQKCLAFLQHVYENIPLSSLPDNCFIGYPKPPPPPTANNQSSNNSSTPSSSSTLPHSRVRLVTVVPDLCYAVIFPAETQAAMAAKAYWQHTGEVVSSRRALHTLQQLGVPLTSTVTPQQHVCHEAHFERDLNHPDNNHHNIAATTTTTTAVVHRELRERIATWSKTGRPDHVFLTHSGMASIYWTLQSARRRHLQYHPSKQGGSSVVFGFPYLDTLKLCSRPEFSPGGVQFFGKAHAADLNDFANYLRTNPQSVSVLFTEVPSNPLLACPDLYALRELANQYNFVLAVDDSISNFLNVDLIESRLADVVCTSLTKLVSGRGDVMAGSCVVNPHTEAGKWMQRDLALTTKSSSPGLLFGPDALALLRNSADFEQRNRLVNQNTEIMADWLVSHPDVETVYYPKHVESAEMYRKLCRPGQGYGGLMSIVLHSHICQRTFYDALDVAKGPSLGTNFTLVCPYTLLAHYHELDFAMSYNVPPNLLRIAIGLESPDQLKAKFEAAFRISRLHPKLEPRHEQHH